MIVTPLRCRSALYVPASNRRALDKAGSLDCDLIIIDLEDAVAPQAKVEARANVVEALQGQGLVGRTVIVRVNALGTPWGPDDLAAVRAAQPHAVLAPKVSSADDVAAYAQALADAQAPVALWAMVETCRAVLRLDEIAGSGQLAGLVFGSNDLLAEMGAASTPGREALLAALGLTVMAAKAYGLTVLDGVLNALDDEAALAAECAQGAALGFDGKTLIHPSQIAVCNQAFSPTSRAVERARAVVAAFADPRNAGQGVLVVDGRMTEHLHLVEARRILAIHDAASAAQSA